jgi:hypothetical protein
MERDMYCGEPKAFIRELAPLWPVESQMVAFERISKNLVKSFAKFGQFLGRLVLWKHRRLAQKVDANVSGEEIEAVRHLALQLYLV